MAKKLTPNIGLELTDTSSTLFKDWWVIINGDGSGETQSNAQKIDTAVGNLNTEVAKKVEKTVDDLTNYYTKSNTYTKTEVNNLISAIELLHLLIVQELPQEGASNTIYLVPDTQAENNIYKEYLWVTNTWELIGSTAIDLNNYYTKTEVDTSLAGKQDTLVGSGVNQNIKTVNGISILGSGNVNIASPFPSSWRTDSLTHLIADVEADQNAVVGKTYLGEVDVTASEGLFNGNAEFMINIMDVQSGDKVLWCIASSATAAPYHWEATFVGGQISPNGCISFQPIITPTNKLSTELISGLANVATSGDYDDLSNKPTIPAAVSGTNDGNNWTSITIGDVTKNIPVGGGPGGSTAWGQITGTLSNQTDLQTALNAKVNSSDLADVAFSGDYNDLDNKPDINVLKLTTPASQEGEPDISSYAVDTWASLDPDIVAEIISSVSETPVVVIDAYNNVWYYELTDERSFDAHTYAFGCLINCAVSLEVDAETGADVIVVTDHTEHYYNTEVVQLDGPVVDPEHPFETANEYATDTWETADAEQVAHIIRDNWDYEDYRTSHLAVIVDNLGKIWSYNITSINSMDAYCFLPEFNCYVQAGVNIVTDAETGDSRIEIGEIIVHNMSGGGGGTLPELGENGQVLTVLKESKIKHIPVPLTNVGKVYFNKNLSIQEVRNLCESIEPEYWSSGQWYNFVWAEGGYFLVIDRTWETDHYEYTLSHSTLGNFFDTINGWYNDAPDYCDFNGISSAEGIGQKNEDLVSWCYCITSGVQEEAVWADPAVSRGDFDYLRRYVQGLYDKQGLDMASGTDENENEVLISGETEKGEQIAVLFDDGSEKPDKKDDKIIIYTKVLSKPNTENSTKLMIVDPVNFEPYFYSFRDEQQKPTETEVENYINKFLSDYNLQKTSFYNIFNEEQQIFVDNIDHNELVLANIWPKSADSAETVIQYEYGGYSDYLHMETGGNEVFAQLGNLGGYILYYYEETY